MIFGQIWSILLAILRLVTNFRFLFQKVKHSTLVFSKLREIPQFILPERVHVDYLRLHRLSFSSKSVIFGLLKKLCGILWVNCGQNVEEVIPVAGSTLNYYKTDLRFES